MSVEFRGLPNESKPQQNGVRNGLRDAMIYLIRKRLRMDTERIRVGQPPLEDSMTTLLFDTKDKNEPLCLEIGKQVTEAQNVFIASGENTQIALTNIVWLLVRTPSAVARLRQELDTAYAVRGLPIGSPQLTIWSNTCRIFAHVSMKLFVCGHLSPVDYPVEYLQVACMSPVSGLVKVSRCLFPLRLSGSP